MPESELHTHEELRTAVLDSHRWVQLIVAAVVLFYFVWFAVILSFPSSHDPAVWGQFGDFVGGMLNPLIAYAAFYWITRSVLIQSTELACTSKALLESAKAQTLQVQHARSSVRVTALQSLIAAATSNIEWTTKELEYVSEQYSRHSGRHPSRTIDGIFIPGGTPTEAYLLEKREALAATQGVREKLLDQMRQELQDGNVA